MSSLAHERKSKKQSKKDELILKKQEAQFSEEINIAEWSNFLTAQPRSQKKILGRITRKTGANLHLVRGTFVRVDGSAVQIRRAKRQISVNVNTALSTHKVPANTKFIFSPQFRTARIVKWEKWDGLMTEDMELLEDLVVIHVDGNMPGSRDSPDWASAANLLGVCEKNWSKIFSTVAYQAGVGRDQATKLRLQVASGKALFFTNPKYKRNLKQQSTRVSVAHLAQELQKQAMRQTIFNRVHSQDFIMKLNSTLSKSKWTCSKEKHFIEMTVVQKDIRARMRVLLEIATESPASVTQQNDTLAETLSDDGIFSAGNPGTSFVEAKLVVKDVQLEEDMLYFLTVIHPKSTPDIQYTLRKKGKIPLSDEQLAALRLELETNADWNHITGELDWPKPAPLLTSDDLAIETEVYALYHKDGKMYRATVCDLPTKAGVKVIFDDYKDDGPYNVALENVQLRKRGKKLGEKYSLDSLRMVKQVTWSDPESGMAINLEFVRDNDEDRVHYEVHYELTGLDEVISNRASGTAGEYPAIETLTARVIDAFMAISNGTALKVKGNQVDLKKADRKKNSGLVSADDILKKGKKAAFFAGLEDDDDSDEDDDWWKGAADKKKDNEKAKKNQSSVTFAKDLEESSGSPSKKSSEKVEIADRFKGMKKKKKKKKKKAA
eukprot:g262.t1